MGIHEECLGREVFALTMGLKRKLSERIGGFIMSNVESKTGGKGSNSIMDSVDRYDLVYHKAMFMAWLSMHVAFTRYIRKIHLHISVSGGNSSRGSSSSIFRTNLGGHTE